jgi:hypothetical protein
MPGAESRIRDLCIWYKTKHYSMYYLVHRCQPLPHVSNHCLRPRLVADIATWPTR